MRHIHKHIMSQRRAFKQSLQKVTENRSDEQQGLMNKQKTRPY